MKRVIHKPYVYYTVPLAIIGLLLLFAGYQNKQSAPTVSDVILDQTQKVVNNATTYSLLPINESELDNRIRKVFSITEGTTGFGSDIVKKVNDNIVQLYGSVDNLLGSGVVKSYRRILIPAGELIIDSKEVTESFSVMIDDNQNKKQSISLLLANVGGEDRLVSYTPFGYKIINFRNLISLYLKSFVDYSNGNIQSATAFYNDNVNGSDTYDISVMYSGMVSVGINFHISPDSIFISDISESNSGLQIMGDLINEIGKSYTFQLDMINVNGRMKIDKIKLHTNNQNIGHNLLR